MTIEIPIFGFINLLASFHAMLVGLALLKHRQSQNVQLRLRFSAMLICVGYLLAIFTLSHYDYLEYSGPVKVSHDLAALLLSGLILEYVRCSLNLKTLLLWAYAPVCLYLLGTVFEGESFYSRIDINHLSTVTISYSLLALVSYLWHLAKRLFRGLDPDRKVSIELFFFSLAVVYTLQLTYTLNSDQSSLLMAAPLAGALILSGFFVFYMFSPLISEYFIKINPTRHTEWGQLEVERIAKHMISDELYLDSQLTISILAEKLGYKPRELSEIINCESGRSFYKFLNSFRIAKARQLLTSESERQTSIEAIGLVCGFKSRSTFYEAFRRETGKTPGEYRGLYS